jgi:glutamate--cysteine ligase
LVSGPSKPAAQPIESKADLVTHLEAGCKPPDAWRIGTEHEKFVFARDDYRRPTYDGPCGIRELFLGMRRFGYQPVYEGENLIALQRADGCSVTFEPGGQIELSGAPLSTLHETCAEVNTHLREVKEIGDELGVGLLGIGFDPKWSRAEVPWMPKQRYALMRDYMPRKGKLGLDMMTRTCTVQVNLDYSSEADMVRKLRISLGLQSVVTAMFANSPFAEGKPTGFLSLRSQVWLDTDPDRCGILPFAFEPGMGFERYVDYALDVPMYFVYRDGRYLDARGQSFRDFLAGKLPALPGERPTRGDWADHLTTLFPEVRLKQYLEQRGADGGPWRRLCALPALWVGLLYSDDALEAAGQLTSEWTAADRQRLRVEVPKSALWTAAPGGRGRTVGDVAADVLAIARRGLEKRNRLNKGGCDESWFLDELQEIVDRRESPARQALRLYETEWEGDVTRAYQHLAY